MKPRTEEFLYFLLWSANLFSRPTFRNLTRSYESWAFRNGFLHRVRALERQHLLERDSARRNERLYRLTKAGRLQALGGRDPQARWSRQWDGRWRLVVFDVPIEQNSHRTRLRRLLRKRGFGCLQKSLWVTPDGLEREVEILSGGKTNVKSLLVLDARPCAGESDADIVAAAWNFKRINSRYKQLLKVLDERPVMALNTPEAALALYVWATSERNAWLSAMQNDPLLPERILPPDYLGRKAWERRGEVLAEAARQLRTFNL